MRGEGKGHLPVLGMLEQQEQCALGSIADENKKLEFLVQGTQTISNFISVFVMTKRKWY